MTKTVSESIEAGAWLLVILLSAVLLFPGCPRPAPGQPPGPVSCALGAVEACAPQVIPLVNECLMGSGDVVACVLAIPKAITCAIYDVLACVVRDQGDRATAAYKANPADTRDHWRAQRAAEFLSRTGAQFAP